jgi:hypothetical protein
MRQVSFRPQEARTALNSSCVLLILVQRSFYSEVMKVEGKKPIRFAGQSGVSAIKQSLIHTGKSPTRVKAATT